MKLTSDFNAKPGQPENINGVTDKPEIANRLKIIIRVESPLCSDKSADSNFCSRSKSKANIKTSAKHVEKAIGDIIPAQITRTRLSKYGAFAKCWGTCFKSTLNVFSHFNHC